MSSCTNSTTRLFRNQLSRDLRTEQFPAPRFQVALGRGRIVNPDIVRAQIESGVVYGISAALWGEVTLKNGRVEQSNFHNYLVLRMNEAPPIEVRAGTRPTCAGWLTWSVRRRRSRLSSKSMCTRSASRRNGSGAWRRSCCTRP